MRSSNAMLEKAETKARKLFRVYVAAARTGTAREYLRASEAWGRAHCEVNRIAGEIVEARKAALRVMGL